MIKSEQEANGELGVSDTKKKEIKQKDATLKMENKVVTLTMKSRYPLSLSNKEKI